MMRFFMVCGSAVLLLASAARADDQTALESTITGNQEQPQVSYIVPWQTPDSPTLKYNVVGEQTAQVFAPIERAELRRELKNLSPLAPAPSKNSQTGKQVSGESQSESKK